MKKMFDSIHKLSSNSKAEKIWLRDELQRLLSERIAVTAGKNNRSHSSSHVSCFPAIDRSKNLSITASDTVYFKLKKSFDVKNKI